jgi:hypothetical protein
MRTDNFLQQKYYDNWQFTIEMCDDYTHDIVECYKTNVLKKQAAIYLGCNFSKRKLSKGEIRQLIAKARKMKNSIKKEDRFHEANLEKIIIWAFNNRNEK